MKLLKPFAILSASFLAASSFAFNAEQTTQIQQIVKNYLVKHPEVLVEAYQSLQKKAQAEKKAQTQKAIEDNKQQLFNDANSPSYGPKNAPVTVVEFSDYQCGHCKDMAPIISKLIKTDKNVRVVFKEFPIFGKNSVIAARAALAANQFGKYLPVHDGIMSLADPLSPKKIPAIIKKAGISTTAWVKAFKSKKVTQQLVQDVGLANRLGLPGTPDFIISDGSEKHFVLLPGGVSMATLQSVIKKVKNS